LFTSTAADSLYFGHGKHACPGRFFAATELRLLLAHLVTHYDLRLPDAAAGRGSAAAQYWPQHDRDA
jgi:cytochrome P450